MDEESGTSCERMMLNPVYLLSLVNAGKKKARIGFDKEQGRSPDIQPDIYPSANLCKAGHYLIPISAENEGGDPVRGRVSMKRAPGEAGLVHHCKQQKIKTVP